MGSNDAQRWSGHSAGLQILEAASDAVQRYLPDGAVEMSSATNDETYTLPENQFISWQRGGGHRHLQWAQRFLFGDYFEPLAAGRNALPGLHAYSHVNALCSAAKAYLVLGDERYLRAAVNGFEFVEAQSFVTGGWGPGEQFLPSAAVDLSSPEAGEIHIPAVETLGDTILETRERKGAGGHFETPCGCYAHFKLTRYLLRISKDPHYGDSMERLMYNAALGVLPLTPFGRTFYQSNYHRYAKKDYFDGYGHVLPEEWTCCSGTLPQLAADYRISTYFRDDEGVFVNLYIPSTVKWSQGGAELALSQVGDYPVSDSMVFSIESSRPARFALRFRIPRWSVNPAIRVNGKAVRWAIEPGSFAKISRRWNDGDSIEVVMPKRLELRAADDKHPDLVALVNGPIVLFAIGYDLPKISREMLLAARQTSPGASEWMSGSIRFLPWWMIKDEIYTTYHDVS